MAEDACELLNFNTILHSPQPEIVGVLEAGEGLFLSQRGNDGNRSVEARTAAGDLVGSVVERLVELLGCINDGYSYVATVVSVKDGEVKVNVHRP